MARDVIVHGALEASKLPDVDLVLSVHDELLFEAGDADWTSVREAVEDRPSWARDLPVKANGAILFRYGKP